MKKTKIEWCDSTWNPVTGCLNGCEYCCARKISERFRGCDIGSTYGEYCQATWKRVNPESLLDDAIFQVDKKCPPIQIHFDKEKQKQISRVAPYPFGFNPTLRRDRFEEPKKWEKPRTIFVCSMADLFGEWIPDEWIEEVFESCMKAPRHRYLFLTKNPNRYCELENSGKLPKSNNFWYGTTVTKEGDKFFSGSIRYNTFISAEPLLSSLNTGIGSFSDVGWIIIGAETGNRKNKIIPQKDWIENICETAKLTGAKIFMKDSLIPIVGSENMKREFPWMED